MERLKQIKQEIANLISSGKVDAAIEKLEKKLPHDYQDTLYQIKAQKKQLEKDILQGIISDEEIVRRRNKLNKSLLALKNHVKEKQSNQTSLKKVRAIDSESHQSLDSSRKKQRWTLFGTFMLIAALLGFFVDSCDLLSKITRYSNIESNDTHYSIPKKGHSFGPFELREKGIITDQRKKGLQIQLIETEGARWDIQGKFAIFEFNNRRDTVTGNESLYITYNDFKYKINVSSYTPHRVEMTISRTESR